MSLTTQTITLTSDHHWGRKVPPHALGHALTALPTVIRQSVSMAFRGRSGVPGPRPRWLKAASDIRFLDHTGEDDTLLLFEAPTLGQAANELYVQQEFWPTRPDPDLTAFDLFEEVVRAVAARDEDSDRFDRALLDRLVGFRLVLDGGFRDLRLGSTRFGAAAVLDADVIETAQRFRDTTPAAQRVRVVGTLDMVRASTQSFGLRLDDGQEVRGVLTTGRVVDTAAHLNRRVIIHGRAIYRASGRLLRIDAEAITEASGAPSFWSRVPSPRRRKLDLAPYRQPQGPRSGMSAIIDRWPGDETDEEVQAALERLS